VPRCARPACAAVLGVLLRPPPQALEAAQRRSLARCRLRADPGRQGIYIEKINGPFPDELKGTPAQYKAGLDCAIAKGWLVLHESGTFVRFTDAGAALFG
jgi:hypothetical protein